VLTSSSQANPSQIIDGVSCTPLIEIRDSQNPSAPINRFGNGNVNHPPAFGSAILNDNLNQASSTQYTDTTSAGPFNLHNINNIDMNAHTSSYLPPQVSVQSGLGATTSNDFKPAGFAFPDGNEMDLSGTQSADQPSPATLSSQSRGGSTSHSSYSPGQHNEHNLPYRASPKPSFNNLNTGLSASALGNSPYAGMDLFSNTYSTSGAMGDETFSQGFLMGNDWEYGAMNAGTGMTPMSDGGWNQMLESVTMGWDSAGPPHPSPGGR
jgi:hypothetical protein